MTRRHGPRARRISGGIVAALLAAASAGSSAMARDPAPTTRQGSTGEASPAGARPGTVASGADTGLFLSAGLVWDRLDLDYDDRATQPEANLIPGVWAHGPSIGIGYAFGPRLRAEMSLSANEHTARPARARGYYVVAHFAGYVPLWTRGWLRPHFVGGLTAAAASLEATGGPDRSYLMMGGDFGGGVRLLCSRHWSIQGDFVHSVLDVDKETLVRDGKDDLRNVGGTGWSDLLRVHLSYDF